MKNFIFIILLLQISLTVFSQNELKNSLYIYVEKSNLKEFKFNQINLENEIHFRLSWPTSGNYKKNILKRGENGQVEKKFDFIIGRSYNLHLKSKNKFDCINQKSLIELLKNKNVIYFSELNLYDVENLMEFFESDFKIYLIYNDFANRVKIYECFKII